MLCDNCASIDLKSYFTKEIHAVKTPSGIRSSQDATRLGTLPDIRKRYSQCDFCSLVFDTLMHSGGRHDWRSPEHYINRAHELGNEGQVAIYSYLFASNTIGDDKEDRDVKEGYRMLIDMLPHKAWDGIRYELALVADADGDQGPALFSARLLRPQRVDVGLAKKWLEICQEQHGSACQIPANDAATAVPDAAPTDLIVINVQDMNLSALPEDAQYMALSYCWPKGTENTFQTTKAVYKDLLLHGGLRRHLSDLTAIVQDAISFVRELGQRYLWVDALCIIQDDPEYKMGQIGQMDLVYGTALATIVCSDFPMLKRGHGIAKNRPDPSHAVTIPTGLTGYRPGTRIRLQTMARIGDLTLIAPCASVEFAFEDSRWTTRAWTFQEFLMAPRKLYFTDLQMYFQCSCAVFAEDTHGEEQRPHSWHRVGTTLYNPADMARPFDDYAEIAWISRSPCTDPIQALHAYRMLHYQYSDRDMTNSGDVIFAFQGAITILTRTLQTAFIAGLPERYFHEALLWFTIGDFLIRSVQEKDGTTTYPYPSWTWAGWLSRTTYNIVFTAMSMSADATYIAGEAQWFLTDKEAMWKLETPTMNEKTREKWDNRLKVLDAGDLPSELSRKLRPRHELALEGGIWNPKLQLMSWSTIARFRINGARYPLGSYGGTCMQSMGNLRIFDRQGRSAGSIILRKEVIGHLLNEGDTHDFMLLSRSLQLTGSLTFFEETIFPRRDWCYINVMLIAEGRQRGMGAAGRFGVGVIHEDAWVAARPRPNYMYLQ